MRRTLELTCAAVGLLLLLPIFSIIALAIELEDGGPVLYRHPRIGKDFRRFHLLKFRSMVTDADRIGTPVTGSRDPRVTTVGRVLRKYKLDELPQLVNVLRGELQFVGARPEVERYVEVFRSQYAVLLRDRPGITDPASLAYRDEEGELGDGDVEQYYLSLILPRKLKLSLEYAERRTFRTDFVLLIQTLLAICRPRPLWQGARNLPPS